MGIMRRWVKGRKGKGMGKKESRGGREGLSGREGVVERGEEEGKMEDLGEGSKQKKKKGGGGAEEGKGELMGVREG